MTTEQQFLEKAIMLAKENPIDEGSPFGAVLVKDGKIIAEGVNKVFATFDSTSHAELNALRIAEKKLKTTRLDGYEVYASGQPCPMCLAAMRMAGITKIVFAYSNKQAEPFGLSSQKVTDDLNPSIEKQTWATIFHMNVDPEATLYKHWQTIK